MPKDVATIRVELTPEAPATEVGSGLLERAAINVIATWRFPSTVKMKVRQFFYLDKALNELAAILEGDEVPPVLAHQLASQDTKPEVATPTQAPAGEVLAEALKQAWSPLPRPFIERAEAILAALPNRQAVEAALTQAPATEVGSGAEAWRKIAAEHRHCGPKYDGCYSHWPFAHCRADGMAWPCDVDAIRSALASQDTKPTDHDEGEGKSIPLPGVNGEPRNEQEAGWE